MNGMQMQMHGRGWDGMKLMMVYVVFLWKSTKFVFGSIFGGSYGWISDMKTKYEEVFAQLIKLQLTGSPVPSSTQDGKERP